MLRSAVGDDVTAREIEAAGGSERLLTVAQVAATLQVDENTIRRWLRQGRLQGTNLGNRAGYRVRQSDLDAFLDALSTRRQEG